MPRDAPRHRGANKQPNARDLVFLLLPDKPPGKSLADLMEEATPYAQSTIETVLKHGRQDGSVVWTRAPGRNLYHRAPQI